jgi:hypothetical protein
MGSKMEVVGVVGVVGTSQSIRRFISNAVVEPARYGTHFLLRLIAPNGPNVTGAWVTLLY